MTGTGAISGSGTSYTIRVTNTGTAAIRCFQVVLPQGVLATGIGAPPAGWQLGSSQPPPAPSFGGRGTTGIVPGAAESFAFTTSAPLPNGSQLKLSSDCTTDVTVLTTGPATPSPPDPAPAPATCKCKKLVWRVGRSGSNDFTSFTRPRDPGEMSLKLGVHYAVECTEGAGNCRGTLTFTVPPALRASLGLRLGRGAGTNWGGGASGAYVCKGPCGSGSGGQAFAFMVEGGRKLGFGRRGVTTKSITLLAVTTCGTKRTRTEVTVVFAPTGRVDLARSDFNGNDVPDGQEKQA